MCIRMKALVKITANQWSISTHTLSQMTAHGHMAASATQTTF